MGTNECSQPATNSSWDSQDFGDISMVLIMAHFRKFTGPRWVKTIPWISCVNRAWKHSLLKRMYIFFFLSPFLMEYDITYISISYECLAPWIRVYSTNWMVSWRYVLFIEHYRMVTFYFVIRYNDLVMTFTFMCVILTLDITHCGLVTLFGSVDLGQHCNGSGNGLLPDDTITCPMWTYHQ